MRDVMYVVVTVAFFALCTGLVRACDLLLGPDEDDLLDVEDDPGSDTEVDDLVAVSGSRS